MAVVAFIRNRSSYDSTRHMGAEQIRMARAEAKRLPSGWFKSEVFKNVDEVAGFAQHGIFLRRAMAGDCVDGTYLEGGDWSNKSETLGSFETIADAMDAIVTLIRTTLSGWGLQLAA